MKALAAFIAINLACFGIAAAIGARSRFYRDLTDDLKEGRSRMIDGLRGWLALGVFFAHASNMYFYFVRGDWAVEQMAFYGNAGQAGVCVFFMITAFLFWGRVLKAQAAFSARDLYLSRVKRIVPMYLASVLMVLAVVAVQSGFELRVGWLTLAKEVRAWLSFGFLQDGPTNGVRGAHYINAVYWTLAYEWMFYLALPLLALFARGAAFGAMLAVAMLFCYTSPITLCFVVGMLIAWMARTRLGSLELSKHWLTPLPVAALLLAFTYHDTFALMPIVLLAIFFLFVVRNNSLFGLLATRAARVLGTISYSIYLVHCIVLYVVVSALHAYVPIAEVGWPIYMGFVAAAAALTVLLSAVTYRYIEHPFLAARARPKTASAARSPGPVLAARGHAQH
jgi:peptidoglycan/LPS O-acetylase OafA/YrhL